MPDVSRRKVAGDQDYACGDDRVMSASKSNAQPNFDPRTQHNMKNVFQTHTAKGSRGHNTSIRILRQDMHGGSSSRSFSPTHRQMSQSIQCCNRTSRGSRGHAIVSVPNQAIEIWGLKWIPQSSCSGWVQQRNTHHGMGPHDHSTDLVGSHAIRPQETELKWKRSLRQGIRTSRNCKFHPWRNWHSPWNWSVEIGLLRMIFDDFSPTSQLGRQHYFFLCFASLGRCGALAAATRLVCYWTKIL